MSNKCKASSYSPRCYAFGPARGSADSHCKQTNHIHEARAVFFCTSWLTRPWGPDRFYGAFCGDIKHRPLGLGFGEIHVGRRPPSRAEEALHGLPAGRAGGAESGRQLRELRQRPGAFGRRRENEAKWSDTMGGSPFFFSPFFLPPTKAVFKFVSSYSYIYIYI